MQQILTVSALLIVGIATSLTASAAQVENGTLKVEAGAVATVAPGKTAILVDSLIMEEASQIELSDETPLFLLWAKHVMAGNGTRIIAQGRAGETPGGDGKDGPTVVLILEDVNNVRGLTVASIGGDGAQGRSGDRGTRGKDASCSSASSGGNGGKGGNGGRGGNAGSGGRVFLIVPQNSSGYGISMITQPGNAGEGGAAGPGGDGGAGKRNCGIWPYFHLGSGDRGPSGSKGGSGTEGKWGGFRTYTVENFQEETLADRLSNIIEVLREGGYPGDADALRAVLDAGGLVHN
ncbi:MAG: hypothetical protein OXU19_03505 [bacterium]|nr:hypothetical protein [bacterium]